MQHLASFETCSQSIIRIGGKFHHVLRWRKWAQILFMQRSPQSYLEAKSWVTRAAIASNSMVIYEVFTSSTRRIRLAAAAALAVSDCTSITCWSPLRLCLLGCTPYFAAVDQRMRPRLRNGSFAWDLLRVHSGDVFFLIAFLSPDISVPASLVTFAPLKHQHPRTISGSPHIQSRDARVHAS